MRVRANGLGVLAALAMSAALDGCANVDFDSQKDLVRRFGAQKQSTLIAFHGSKEQGRSVGDSNRASISDLLSMVL